MCIAFAEAMKEIAPEEEWHVPDTPEPGYYSTDQGMYNLLLRRRKCLLTPV